MSKKLKVLLSYTEKSGEEGWDVKMLIKVPKIGIIYADFTKRHSELVKDAKDFSYIISHGLCPEMTNPILFTIHLIENKGIEKLFGKFQNEPIRLIRQLSPGRILQWSIRFSYHFVSLEKTHQDTFYVSLEDKLIRFDFTEELLRLPKSSVSSFFDFPVVCIEIGKNDAFIPT